MSRTRPAMQEKKTMELTLPSRLERAGLTTGAASMVHEGIPPRCTCDKSAHPEVRKRDCDQQVYQNWLRFVR